MSSSACIERFELVAPGIDLVIDRRRGDARLPRERQAAGLAAVRQNQRDFGGKIGRARRRDQRGHVGAAPGDEDRGAPPRRHSVRLPRRTTRAPSLATISPRRIGASPCSASASRRLGARARPHERDHADPAIEGAQHLGVARRRRSLRASRTPAAARRRQDRARTARPSGRTRGRLSGKPPPVICASAMIAVAVPRSPAAAASHRCGSASAAPARASATGSNGAGASPGQPAALDDAAHQGKAVGMQARGRQAENHVADLQARRAAAAAPRSAAPTAKPARS